MWRVEVLVSFGFKDFNINFINIFKQIVGDFKYRFEEDKKRTDLSQNYGEV